MSLIYIFNAYAVLIEQSSMQNKSKMDCFHPFSVGPQRHAIGTVSRGKIDVRNLQVLNYELPF